MTDAAKAGRKLADVGYKVTLVVDPGTSRLELVERWGGFLAEVGQSDEVVLYYSGHGVEIQGANYFVPRDAPKAENIRAECSLKLVLPPIDAFMSDLKDRDVALAVLILDACRDNPFTFSSKTLGGAVGLVPPGTELGRFVFYAASAHETALAEKGGDADVDGSVSTRVSLEQFDANKHHERRDFATALRRPVAALATPHPQHPAYEDGLGGSWCFDGCQATQVSVGVLVGNGQIAQVGSTEDAAALVRPARPYAWSAGSEAGTPAPRPGVPAVTPPSNTPQNAIFLGKTSSRPAGSQDCPAEVTDALPFGCDPRPRSSRRSPSRKRAATCTCR